MSTLKVNKIESTASTDGGISIDTSGHVRIEGYPLASAGAFSNRNMIINGDFTINQRNSGLTGVKNGWAFDRWYLGHSDADELECTVGDVGQPSAPNGFNNGISITVTTAETTVEGAYQQYVRYRLEGFDCQRLAYGSTGAEKATLSFWVKTNRTGVYSVRCFRPDGSMRAFNFNYTITATDVTNGWKYIEQVIPADTTQIIPNDNTYGLEFRWYLASGSDYTTGTQHGPGWTNYDSASAAKGQTANCSTVSSEWSMTGVQFELGSKATPYEYRSQQEELARCQRYYYAHPGTVWSSRYSTSNAMTHIFFPVTMLKSPTVSFSYASTGSGTTSTNVLETNYFRSYVTNDSAYSISGVKLEAEI